MDEDQPISESHFNQDRLVRAIKRLWAVVVVQSHFVGTSQIVGKSMSVGIRIFSIVEGLGFGGDRSRGFVLWQLAGLVLR